MGEPARESACEARPKERHAVQTGACGEARDGRLVDEGREGPLAGALSITLHVYK